MRALKKRLSDDPAAVGSRIGAFLAIAALAILSVAFVACSARASRESGSAANDDKLFATVLLRVSPAEFAGAFTIEYAHRDDGFVMESVDFKTLDIER
jgi:hypothetical protein